MSLSQVESPEVDSSSPILELRNVCQYFKDKNGNIITAAENVNLVIGRGEVLALVGESGSGKTTIGRLSVGLGNPSKGQIILDGQDIRKYKKSSIRKTAQYVHQDPYSALDPYLSVREVLERPLVYIKGMRSSDTRENVMIRTLEDMGLDRYILDKSVRELSGGQKQRVLLARAFVIGPNYVVADEPTTMVDFVWRTEIMSLLSDLKKKSRISVLLITHDVSVASSLADRMAVMYRGEIVEFGKTNEIISNPQHPYTLALLSVTPENLMKNESRLLVHKRTNVTIPGNFPGCKYSFLCPYAFDRCTRSRPTLVEIGGEHRVSCYKVTG